MIGLTGAEIWPFDERFSYINGDTILGKSKSKTGLTGPYKTGLMGILTCSVHDTKNAKLAEIEAFQNLSLENSTEELWKTSSPCGVFWYVNVNVKRLSKTGFPYIPYTNGNDRYVRGSLHTDVKTSELQRNEILYNFNSYLRDQIHKRFKHSFGPIRAGMAEIEAFQNFFNFSSFVFVLPNGVSQGLSCGLGSNGAKYRNKGLKLAVKYDAGSFIWVDSESLIFSLKDGGTNAGKLFVLPRIQTVIYNQFENVKNKNNIYNIKVSTDKYFEHSFGSFRAKTAELQSIDNLELLHISNTEDIVFVRVSEAHASEVSHALAASHVVPQANANANADANANANAIPFNSYKTGLMGILTRFCKTGSFHDINYAKDKVYI
jgi:hypothetical protein